MANQIIDINRIRGISDGDRDFEREVITLFFADAETQLDCIERAIVAPSMEDIRGYAHALKGSSANVGAIHLQDLAADLERDAQAGQCEHIATKHRQLKQVFSETRDAFDQALT